MDDTPSVNTSGSILASPTAGSSTGTAAPALNVNGLYPKLAEAVPLIIAEARVRKLPEVFLQSSIRSIEAQDGIYWLGRKVKNPDGASEANPMGDTVTRTIGGYSWHNYGLAVDLVFKDAKGEPTWDRPFADWENLGKIGEMYGLEWGGRWPEKKRDCPHFQFVGKLRNFKMSALRDIAIQKGIDAVWSLI